MIHIYFYVINIDLIGSCIFIDLDMNANPNPAFRALPLVQLVELINRPMPTITDMPIARRTVKTVVHSEDVNNIQEYPRTTYGLKRIARGIKAVRTDTDIEAPVFKADIDVTICNMSTLEMLNRKTLNLQARRTLLDTQSSRIAQRFYKAVSDFDAYTNLTVDSADLQGPDGARNNVLVQEARALIDSLYQQYKDVYRKVSFVHADININAVTTEFVLAMNKGKMSMRTHTFIYIHDIIFI